MMDTGNIGCTVLKDERLPFEREASIVLDNGRCNRRSLRQIPAAQNESLPLACQLVSRKLPVASTIRYEEPPLKVNFLSGQRFCTVVFLDNLAPNAVFGPDGTRADSAPIIEDLGLADE
jgi:hypothetical protein